MFLQWSCNVFVFLFLNLQWLDPSVWTELEWEWFDVPDVWTLLTLLISILIPLCAFRSNYYCMLFCTIWTMWIYILLYKKMHFIWFCTPFLPGVAFCIKLSIAIPHFASVGAKATRVCLGVWVCVCVFSLSVWSEVFIVWDTKTHKQAKCCFAREPCAFTEVLKQS